MSKRLLIFLAAVAVCAITLYLFHNYLLMSTEEIMRVPLEAIYWFHFISLALICSGVHVLSARLPSQVGYAYLASVFVKIGLFVLIFKGTIFSHEELSMAERLTIVVPMFVFLTIEAAYCGRLMNKA